MNKKIELTQEIVRELLDYDPETGLFFWKERNIAWFEDGKRWKAHHKKQAWNKKWAGKVAFSNNNSEGYLQGVLLGNNVKAHRVVWLWMFGENPFGEIDHKDGDRSNNSLENLRDVTKSQNQRNTFIRKTNKSGRVGVYFHKASNKWSANIRDDRTQVHLGVFTSKEEAIKCRQLAEIKYGYDKRHGIKNEN